MSAKEESPDMKGEEIVKIVGNVAKGIGFVFIGLILAGVVGMMLGDDASPSDTPVVQESPPVVETPVVAPTPQTPPSETETPEITQPVEHDNALRSAQNYLKVMAMSKGKLYDQLVYEQYSAEAAQYAVDTIEANWNEQAVKSAQNYQKVMPMSSGKLYDQLVYEQFTPEQAQYAIDQLPSETAADGAASANETALRSAENYLKLMPMSKGKLYDQLLYEQYSAEAAQYAVDTIQADWNEQAVKSARNYQEIMPMSSGKLYNQLIYEQFTPEQAQYAIDNL